MTVKKKKTDYDEDIVHVDFKGKRALFIRRIAYLTERSNNEAGNMLIDLLMAAHQKISVELKPNAEIPAKGNKEAVKFNQTAETVVRIDLDELP